MNLHVASAIAASVTQLISLNRMLMFPPGPCIEFESSGHRAELQIQETLAGNSPEAPVG